MAKKVSNIVKRYAVGGGGPYSPGMGGGSGKPNPIPKRDGGPGGDKTLVEILQGGYDELRDKFKKVRDRLPKIPQPKLPKIWPDHAPYNYGDPKDWLRIMQDAGKASKR